MNLNKICCTSLPQVKLPSEEKFKIIAEAGFTNVGLWMDEITRYLEKGNSLFDLKKNLSCHGLKAVELHKLKDWLYAEGKQREKTQDEMKKMCGVAKVLNIDYICTPAHGKGKNAIAQKNFKKICQIALEYDLQVALEFLGYEKINAIKSAQDLIDAADVNNGGLIIDTAHFFTGTSTWDDLQKIPVEKIMLLHVNDLLAPFKGLSSEDIRGKTRNERLIPGDGSFPLRYFFSILEEKKYKGYISLEIFNKQFTKYNYATIIKHGYIKTKKFIEDAEL